VSVDLLSRRAAPDGVPGLVAGQVIRGLRRHGKHILFELGRGLLDVHLRMTGKLLLNGNGTHPRARIMLDEGFIVFDDIRQFGYLRWLESAEKIENLGPDALNLSSNEFAARMRSRKGRIKPALLDQSMVSGLGNIYVDEALFRARIHPCATLRRISVRRLHALHGSIAELLAEAIASGGSTISNYVDSTGARGTFQSRHKVYGREGEPCASCGGPVKRIVVAQRGTHYCPRCQRA